MSTCCHDTAQIIIILHRDIIYNDYKISPLYSQLQKFHRESIGRIDGTTHYIWGSRPSSPLMHFLVAYSHSEC